MDNLKILAPGVPVLRFLLEHARPTLRWTGVSTCEKIHKCTGVNYGQGRRCNFFDNGQVSLFWSFTLQNYAPGANNLLQKGTITDPSVSSAWRENEPAPPPPKPSPDPSPKPNPGTPSDADTVAEPKCPDEDDKHYVGPEVGSTFI